jgi:hypothetical protein
MRGGNFSSHPTYLRSAFRYDYDPKVGYAFRVVMEAAPSDRSDAPDGAEPRER